MRISATLPASSRGFQPAFLAVASATFDDQSPCSRRAGRSRLIVSGSGTTSRVERAARRAAASWSRITVGGLSGGGRAEAPYPAAPPAPEPVIARRQARGRPGACDRRPRRRPAFRNGHAPEFDGGGPRRPPSRWEAPMFRKLGTWCHDHRRLVVVLWVVALLAIGLLSRTAGSNLLDTLQPPLVRERQGLRPARQRVRRARSSSSATIVFSADAGVTDPTVQAEMQAYFDRITAETGVQVVSPYGPQGATPDRHLGDQAGTVAFARLEMPDGSMGSSSATSASRSSRSAPTVDGLRIEFGGNAFGDVQAAVVGGPRPRLRHRHPHPGLRLGARHGPAHRRGPRRHRHRQRPHRPAQPRAHRCPTSPPPSA